MAWLIRRSAALIAAYSIALQALLLGFAPAHHFNFDSFAIICTADSSGDHQPTPPRHRSDCDACLAACSSSPALIPASVMKSNGDGKNQAVIGENEIGRYWHLPRAVPCQRREHVAGFA